MDTSSESSIENDVERLRVSSSPSSDDENWKVHIDWKMVAYEVMMVRAMHLQVFQYSSIWRGILHMVESL
jgi:hypothetical protein